MTPRVHAVLIIGVLLILAVLIPALIAYQAGVEVGREERVGQLEQRIEQVETDVSLLRE